MVRMGCKLTIDCLSEELCFPLSLQGCICAAPRKFWPDIDLS